MGQGLEEVRFEALEIGGGGPGHEKYISKYSYIVNLVV
jgi:hypothetical protein